MSHSVAVLTQVVKGQLMVLEVGLAPATVARMVGAVAVYSVLANTLATTRHRSPHCRVACLSHSLTHSLDWERQCQRRYLHLEQKPCH
jgi:hypothetical protein